MSLSESDYRHQVNALLPRGPIWRRSVGGKLDAILYALEREATRVDNRACAVLEEDDPRTSFEELERWFSDWGIPSECIKALADPTLEDMRQELLTKITSNLGLTKAFFEALAGTLGYDAEIETYQAHTVEDGVDDALKGIEWTSAMTLGVRVKSSGGAEVFRVTWSVNNALAKWGDALLECVVRAMAPANVYVLFAYEDE